MNLLVENKYTIENVRNKRTITLYVQNVIRHAKNANFTTINNQLTWTWNHLALDLQRDIRKSTFKIIVLKFMNQLKKLQHAWKRYYAMKISSRNVEILKVNQVNCSHLQINTLSINNQIKAIRVKKSTWTIKTSIKFFRRILNDRIKTTIRQAIKTTIKRSTRVTINETIRIVKINISATHYQSISRMINNAWLKHSHRDKLRERSSHTTFFSSIQYKFRHLLITRVRKITINRKSITIKKRRKLNIKNSSITMQWLKFSLTIAISLNWAWILEHVTNVRLLSITQTNYVIIFELSLRWFTSQYI